MSGIQPSINDREYDLLNKITQNTAGIVDGGGVTSIVAGAGISVSGGTGAVTVTNRIQANQGTFTLSGGAATVADTHVTANSVILHTIKTVSGTRTSFLVTPTVGVGFSVSGGAGTDNGTYNYIILQVN